MSTYVHDRLVEAKHLYREEIIRHKVIFTCVHLERLEKALKVKGDSFCSWLSKLVNGFYNVRKWTSINFPRGKIPYFL